MRFYIFTILLFFLSIPSGIACSAAYQYSLFPMGMSMGQLIVLELEMERYLKTPENQLMRMGVPFGQEDDNFESDNSLIEVRWKGTIKLHSYDQGNLKLIEDFGTTDLLDKHYTEALQPFFTKAMEAAKQLPMFTEATLQSIGTCHFDRSCTFFRTSINKEKIAFYCTNNEKNYDTDSVKVIFPKKIMEKTEMQFKTKFTEFETLDKQIRIDFYRIWSPQCVRRYDIGGQVIQVYSLGKGNKSKYFLDKETERKSPNLERIDKLILGNDVLYHGWRFDCIQIL